MRSYLLAGAMLAFVVGVPAVAAPTAATTSEDARLTAFLDKAFDEQAATSPQELTSLGIKTEYDKLDDYTAAGADRDLALAARQLAAMKRDFDPARLGPQGKLSYRLFDYDVARGEMMRKWRGNRFPVTNNGSPMGNIPVFMINQHKVKSVADAQAYVARLTEVERVMREVSDRVRAQAEAGVVPPKFVFAPVKADGMRVLTGAPFEASGKDSTLWADFQKKVAALDAPAATKDKLRADGKAALLGPVRRGYTSLLATMDAIEPKAPAEAGASSLPGGQAYYADMLKFSTTTDLSADAIHKIGLSEVDRLHKEMETIKAKVGFTGTLPAFFQYIKDDPKFEYPNTEAGKEQYLADARKLIAQVMATAPSFFLRLPKAPLEVRAVEPFREATAAVAFYNSPSPDGSRPGIFYVNLSDMRQVIKPQIEAITYHEAAPGHHFQNAFAQELQGLPKFRRFGGYSAYGEGWGLYAEGLGKEMGFYTDPYADFGRLSLDLWRATRLVTDTGLHAKGWTRQQAMDYFKANTLLSDRDIQKEVERYIVNPGQATSYKIGQLKILELRKRARTALGAKFDVRKFHDVILGSADMPLDMLEELVDAWIAEAK